MAGNKIDLTGQRFGRLKVISESPKRSKNGGAYWHCECDCGNTVDVHGANLRKGLTLSCSCQRRENSRAAILVHGRTGSKTYHAWEAMIQRCTNPNNPRYADYGGRGIRVCDRWRNDFAAFLADMGEPDPGMELDRVDNNGDYKPSNCCWTTRKKQVRNTRRNRMIEYQGRKQCRTDWAAELGVHPDILRHRIDRLGWSIEKAFTTPVNSRNNSRNLTRGDS